jgi:hypothetical protein
VYLFPITALIRHFIIHELWITCSTDCCADAFFFTKPLIEHTNKTVFQRNVETTTKKSIYLQYEIRTINFIFQLRFLRKWIIDRNAQVKKSIWKAALAQCFHLQSLNLVLIDCIRFNVSTIWTSSGIFISQSFYWNLCYIWVVVNDNN